MRRDGESCCPVVQAQLELCTYDETSVDAKKASCLGARCHALARGITTDTSSCAQYFAIGGHTSTK